MIFHTGDSNSHGSSSSSNRPGGEEEGYYGKLLFTMLIKTASFDHASDSSSNASSSQASSNSGGISSRAAATNHSQDETESGFGLFSIFNIFSSSSGENDDNNKHLQKDSRGIERTNNSNSNSSSNSKKQEYRSDDYLLSTINGSFYKNSYQHTYLSTKQSPKRALDSEVLELLFLCNEKDLAWTSIEGDSILHAAAFSELISPKTFLLILRAFLPNINIRGKYGRSPLHIAAREGRDEHVKILLEFGADFRLRDTKGRSARDLATPSCAAILDNHLLSSCTFLGADDNIKQPLGAQRDRKLSSIPFSSTLSVAPAIALESQQLLKSLSSQYQLKSVSSNGASNEDAKIEEGEEEDGDNEKEVLKFSVATPMATPNGSTSQKERVEIASPLPLKFSLTPNTQKPFSLFENDQQNDESLDGYTVYVNGREVFIPLNKNERGTRSPSRSISKSPVDKKLSSSTATTITTKEIVMTLPKELSLGMMIHQLTSGEIEVLKLLDDFPAIQAGIEVGDRIININHEDVQGRDLEHVKSLLREGNDGRISLIIQRSRKEQ